MLKDFIHKRICERRTAVDQWFVEKGQDLVFPIYTSFDIRDSGVKIVPVDANIFPAGFNNICSDDKETSSQIMALYLKKYYPKLDGRIALLTEEHTGNGYYWDNVKTLRDIIRDGGYDVCLGNPGSEKITTVAAAGEEMVAPSVEIRAGKVFVDEQEIDLAVSNNDFSKSYGADWGDLITPLNPPYALGWHQREKGDFFYLYNKLADELANILDVDPFVFQIETETFKEFDLSSEASRNRLGDLVDQKLAKLETIYQEKSAGIDPYLYIKNASGTYGMAVIQVKSGDEVRSLNYKSRKKMKAAKGGGGVQSVILQEGVISEVRDDGATAEPAIYMIGSELAGGFLRVHDKKGPQDNLNSPGAIYKKLCVSDLSVDLTGCIMENVYGWVAKLGALAVAQEAKLVMKNS